MKNLDIDLLEKLSVRVSPEIVASVYKLISERDAILSQIEDYKSGNTKSRSSEPGLRGATGRDGKRSCDCECSESKRPR